MIGMFLHPCFEFGQQPTCDVQVLCRGPIGSCNHGVGQQVVHGVVELDVAAFVTDADIEEGAQAIAVAIGDTVVIERILVLIFAATQCHQTVEHGGQVAALLLIGAVEPGRERCGIALVGSGQRSAQITIVFRPLGDRRSRIAGRCGVAHRVVPPTGGDEQDHYSEHEAVLHVELRFLELCSAWFTLNSTFFTLRSTGDRWS